VFQYPNLQHAGGISSSLTAGLYKLIIPTTHENLNWHFRIFSMATLLISSFSLFQTAIPKNPGLRTAAFLNYRHIGLPVPGTLERSCDGNISESVSDRSPPVMANDSCRTILGLVWLGQS
jgi:hypothetical protein